MPNAFLKGVCPSTLILENVWNLKANTDPTGQCEFVSFAYYPLQISIDLIFQKFQAPTSVVPSWLDLQPSR